MPKVKTCKLTVNGAVFESTLKVDAKGLFSINRPGTKEDWPDGITISSDTAENVTQQWEQSVRAIATRTSKEEKVIAVIFDSIIRPNGQKDTFTDRNCLMALRCVNAIRVKTIQGDKVTITYKRDPRHSGLHSEPQPYPTMMVIRDFHEISYRKETCTIIEWSQEVEDLLVNACTGITKIVDLLDTVLSTPESLLLTASSRANINQPILTLPQILGGLERSSSPSSPKEDGDGSETAVVAS